MSVHLLHDVRDPKHELVWNVFLEKVAHRIHEHHARSLPPSWFAQLFGNQSQVEPLLVRMTMHAAKTLGEGLGVTMGTTGTNFDASPDRIPSRIGPFNRRVFAHLK